MISEEDAMIERLRTAIHKYQKWGGASTGEMVENGYLEEGDMG